MVARRLINNYYTATPGPYGPIADPGMMPQHGYNGGQVDPADPVYASPYVDDSLVGARGRRARRLLRTRCGPGYGDPVTGGLVGGRRRAGPVSMLVGGVREMLVDRQDNRYAGGMQQQMSRSAGAQSYTNDPREQRLATPRRPQQQQQSRALTPDGRGIRLNTPRSSDRATSTGRQLSDDEDEDYEDHEHYAPDLAREYEKHHQNVGRQGHRQQEEWQPGPPSYEAAVNERPAGSARRA